MKQFCGYDNLLLKKKKSPRSVIANLPFILGTCLSSYLTVLSEVIVEKYIEKWITLPHV